MIQPKWDNLAESTQKKMMSGTSTTQEQLDEAYREGYRQALNELAGHGGVGVVSHRNIGNNIDKAWESPPGHSDSEVGFKGSFIGQIVIIDGVTYFWNGYHWYEADYSTQGG